MPVRVDTAVEARLTDRLHGSVAVTRVRTAGLQPSGSR